jgi:hypothetical protein
MKKKLIVLLLFSICFLAFADVILKLEDPLFDDYGDGNVSYPEHPMFTNGIFDLTEFRIEDNGDNYDFVIGVRGKIEFVKYEEYNYRYNIPDDFILPLIQIYIDMDAHQNSGITETIAGANLSIKENSGWERAIVFTSMPRRFKLQTEHYQPHLVSRIFFSDRIHRSANRKELRVNVPKSFLGEIQPDWGYLVLMLGHDFSSNMKQNVFTIEVQSTASQFNFGGGHGSIYSRYNSNVIDMIVPPFQSQKKILQNYNIKDKTYAEAEAVYLHKIEKTAEFASGEVKQVSAEKVVINLGAKHGVKEGTKLIIASRFVVEVDDVFPELSIAHFLDETDADKIEPDMETKIWQE